MNSRASSVVAQGSHQRSARGYLKSYRVLFQEQGPAPAPHSSLSQGTAGLPLSKRGQPCRGSPHCGVVMRDAAAGSDKSAQSQESLTHSDVIVTQAGSCPTQSSQPSTPRDAAQVSPRPGGQASHRERQLKLRQGVSAAFPT